MSLQYTFDGELWLYPGTGAWVFITLPFDFAREIKLISGLPRRGFGSIRVTAQIGASSWNTSIFPDSKSNSYMLPVKKEIREKNNLASGDKAKIIIAIKDL
jgi:hypothetical protein